MILTDRQIDAYRQEAYRLGLSGYALLLDTPNDVIRMVCNGIGPSGFPPWALWMLERLLPHIVLPSLIHDLRYWYGNGTYTNFMAANAELAFNSRLVAWRGVAWWRVGRKVAVALAGLLCAKLCDWFGWTAYCTAIKERREAEDAALLA